VPEGMPLSPKKAKEGYSNNLGCILYETANINDTKLRSKANTDKRKLLISKLHQRYKFLDEDQDENKIINFTAISLFSRLLSGWKCKLKAQDVTKKLEFDEIHKKWPMIDKAE
jgi:hypothetical protein